MIENLAHLKNIGHKLLDEYIALDITKGHQAEKLHAYRELAKKLKWENSSAHFGRMTTSKEVLEAIRKLERMIKKRKNRIEFYGSDKIVFAPNVRELQKQATELNKGRITN